MKKEEKRMTKKIYKNNQNITSEDKRKIGIFGLAKNTANQKQKKENNYKELNDDIMDMKILEQEVKIDVSLLNIFDKETPTEFLKMLMDKIVLKNQTLSDIKLPKITRQQKNNTNEFKDYEICYKGSSLLQNIISNLIRTELKIIENKKLIPKRIRDSNIDITIDITHMSNEQRIAAILIASGLSFSFNKYEVNIRISVFGERDGVWLLSNDFSLNVDSQLSKLRDALSCKKRIMSFPGDALYGLINDFKGKYSNYNKKYVPILISSLISPQVICKKVKWNILPERIIVFGLKSLFEEDFMKENNVYEELLRIKSENKNQIIQEFLEPEKVILQSKDLEETYNKLCKSIIASLIYELDDKEENFKIQDIFINENIKYEIIDINKLKDMIEKNKFNKEYFAQNISCTTTEISKMHLNTEEILKITLPDNSQIEKLINLNNTLNDENMPIDIVNYTKGVLLPILNLALTSNYSTGKVPSASGGTISITGLKKWIISGFTYREIFLKRTGKNKRKYNITIALDFSISVNLDCNYTHTIATILLILLTFETIPNNEEITIDILISTKNGIKIICLNNKAINFKTLSYLYIIIQTIDRELNYSCCPGSILLTSYNLQLKSRVLGKKIILITDSFVISKKEVEIAYSVSNKCENLGIELIAIGVGSAPYFLKELYSKCCFSPCINYLGNALAFTFSLSKDPSPEEIFPQLIYENLNIVEKLEEMIKKDPIDQNLKKSIEEKQMNIIEIIGNYQTMTLEGTKSLIENPEEEPYYNNSFKGYKILIVILYLGNYKYFGKIRDENITLEIFEKNTNAALKKKGFETTIVFSYGEAIKELTKDENEYCPYIETMIFCSRGDKSLPENAEDKDVNKIVPFLKTVSEFNKNGGGLFLFCDNEPFTFEVNLLLTKYLQFEDIKGGKANFIMKGNYNEPIPEKKFINCNNSSEIKAGTFDSTIKIKSPGEYKERLSLRPGLIKFSEGITLSYAVNEDGNDDYSPFTPFAYLTDKNDKPKPFILYYDPKIKEAISRGPIVVHGGFTSAFYDFDFDGTGRLVISIACWLVRIEERIYQYNTYNKLIKIPLIKHPEEEKEEFKEWNIINTLTLNSTYSILLLDISGSMEDKYQELIEMANNIIENQNKNPENKGTIIFFGSEAHLISSGELRNLSLSDISNTVDSRGTNFDKPFSLALQYINNKENFKKKRLLFLTDGIASSYFLPKKCDIISKAGFSIYILGFGNSSSFEHLRKLIRGEGTFQSHENFQDIVSSAVKIFAT